MTKIADYIMRGTKRLITYAIAQGVNMSGGGRERLASAIGIPVINLVGEGRDNSYVSPKYNEAQAQNLVSILGAADAETVTTNTGQEVVG